VASAGVSPSWEAPALQVLPLSRLRAGSDGTACRHLHRNLSKFHPIYRNFTPFIEISTHLSKLIEID
jgi:hypothetical protein